MTNPEQHTADMLVARAKARWPYRASFDTTTGEWELASITGVDATEAQALVIRKVSRCKRLLDRVAGQARDATYDHLNRHLFLTAQAANEFAREPVKLADIAKQADELEREIALTYLVPDVRERISQVARNSLFLGLLLLGFWCAQYYAPTLWADLTDRVGQTPKDLWLIAVGVLMGRFVTFMALIPKIEPKEDSYYTTMKSLPAGLGPMRDIVVAAVVYLILFFGLISFGTDPMSVARSPTPGATEAAIFVFGALVGLVMPQVVDRLTQTAGQMFAESAD